MYVIKIDKRLKVFYDELTDDDNPVIFKVTDEIKNREDYEMREEVKENNSRL